MEQSVSTDRDATGGANQKLQQLLSEVYEDNLDELALGLGRPAGQVLSWLDGSREPDEDGIEKINALAAIRLGENGDKRPPAAARSDNTSIEQRL